MCQRAWEGSDTKAAYCFFRLSPGETNYHLISIWVDFCILKSTFFLSTTEIPVLILKILISDFERAIALVLHPQWYQ